MGAAMGAGAGLAVAMAMDNEEKEDKERRKRHKGADQILLMIRNTARDTVIKVIAAVFDDWMVLGGELHEKSEGILWNSEVLVDYIRVRTREDGNVTVLIKIYDEDGYRNIDEDDIYAILSAIRVAFKESWMDLTR
jgi:hypothetical protein